MSTPTEGGTLRNEESKHADNLTRVWGRECDWRCKSCDFEWHHTRGEPLHCPFCNSLRFESMPGLAERIRAALTDAELDAILHRADSAAAVYTPPSMEHWCEVWREGIIAAIAGKTTEEV